ncbi:leucine-rich repeat and IQ domain-containing protein 3 isoform X1 [Talpa occidentalis]|uniref:leucine-rich repeat and IQ domain-containing protein 3 isoform X1 n=1 Tax=Talpa occidentalis TaxID=50954 RepID=UPI00188F7A6A|nr:leucine-rich repeat and IQ domain-containing protein 3 isoform X1 [Talpa occidentalis]
MFHGTITKELTSHEEWRHYNENIIEDQKDFVFVKFNGLHLKSMENLQSFISLRVCIFSNNFITDIHPLQGCIKLVKLDLHGNQIKSLPDTTFWSRLKNLKLLYLHDNGFVKLRNICTLSACPNLIALTMFDCPVSLKKGYRHVLVNSIWSLKALDNYVISDEEIIQNWRLPERFKTCNHRLYFNFCPPLKKGSTYEAELNDIRYIIAKINEILAHNSPVLIVQRWTRGFLVRKKLRPLFSYKKQREKFMKESKTKWIYLPKGYEDSFFKDLFIQPETSIKSKCAYWRHNMQSPVDLKSLTEQREHVFPILYEFKTKVPGKKSKLPRHRIQKGQKDSDSEIEDEEFDAGFTISVFKLPIYTFDSVKYAAVLKEKEQRTLRPYDQAFTTTHQKPVIEKKDTLLDKNMRRLFLTTKIPGIKLQPLSDVDKYYSGKKKQELHQKKVAAVAMAQAAQERVSLTVQETLNKKKYAAQKLIRKDKEILQNGLQQLWQDRFIYLEKVRQRRAAFLEEKNRKTEDRLLIQNLNNERIHLLKGMNKIDRWKKNEKVLKEKSKIVKQKWEAEKYQRNLNKQINNVRIREICKRHLEEKFVADMFVFQKNCERLQDIKTKVAIMKMNKIPNVFTSDHIQ